MENDTPNSSSQDLVDDEIEQHKNVNSAFTDFTRFEDPEEIRRQTSKSRFIDGSDYVPLYQYPKLRFFKDEASTVSKKTDVYNAVLEIEYARKSAELIGDEKKAAELMLYRGFHDLRLKKIMLVEAAQHLHDAGSSSAQEIARETFMQMNEEVYGEIDAELFRSILSGERAKVDGFIPTNDLADVISGELRAVLEKIGEPGANEPELLTTEELQVLQKVVLERYQPILSVIPDSDDSIYYDAQQCAEIINDTLMAGGLANDGWECVVNPLKSNPTTNGTSKKIFLPSSTRRNASELRRLVVHEQEVHARRSQNGDNSGSKVISGGSADYAAAEEGLGVMLECAVEGNLSNPSFKRARERYLTAGLALGLDGGGARDAREVYEIVWRMVAIDGAKDGAISEDQVDKAKDKAYSYIENAYRGTGFWMKGIIYTKLKVYYEGFVQNARYVRENIGDLNKALDTATVGKINHVNINEAHLVNKIIAV